MHVIKIGEVEEEVIDSGSERSAWVVSVGSQHECSAWVVNVSGQCEWAA